MGCAGSGTSAKTPGLSRLGLQIVFLSSVRLSSRAAVGPLFFVCPGAGGLPRLLGQRVCPRSLCFIFWVPGCGCTFVRYHMWLFVF